MKKTFGISFENLQLDYAAAVERSRKPLNVYVWCCFAVENTFGDVLKGNANINQDKKITIQTKPED